jgi:hypothetical protein
MSAEVLEILYVGNAVAGEAFKDCFEPFGWNVYVPTNRMEALGMYITYVPHLVILDTLKDSALTQDVYRNIRTVGATPVIVVGTIGEIEDAAARTVPACTPLSTLAFLARELVECYPRVF